MYIVETEEGYLIYTENLAYSGIKCNITFTNNINEATVFRHINARLHSRLEHTTHYIREVEVEQIVRLK